MLFGAGVDMPLSRKMKICLFFSAVLILCNYYYLYLFDFDQGVGSAGWAFAGLKFLSLLFFYILILSPVYRRFSNPEDFLFPMFMIFSVVFFTVKKIFYDVGGYLFFNMIACGLPFFIFQINKNFSRVRFFLESCLIVLVIQVSVDVFILLAGYSLWENKAFVGGLGNPSSFGFVCNIFVCYILYLRRFDWFSLFALFVLSYGVFGTSSMLSVFMLGMVLLSWMVSRAGRWFLFYLVVIFGFFIFNYEGFLSEHLLYKINSLVNLMGGDVEGASSSVALRLDIHRYFIEQLGLNFFEVLLYGYPGSYYYQVDSQYLTYVGSFGLLGASLFFFSIIFAGVSAYKLRTGFGYFSAVLGVMFLLVFISNRIVDYYPVALFLFLVFTSASDAKFRQMKVLPVNIIKAVV